MATAALLLENAQKRRCGRSRGSDVNRRRKTEGTAASASRARSLAPPVAVYVNWAEEASARFAPMLLAVRGVQGPRPQRTTGHRGSCGPANSATQAPLDPRSNPTDFAMVGVSQQA